MNPNAPLLSLVTSTAIAFLYWWWIEVCYSYNGFYPYPIFALLSTAQRIGLFAVSGATMWVVGGALRAAYAWANGFEDVKELESDWEQKRVNRGEVVENRIWFLFS
jgi:hypothetical protein